jgi:hypothetical protein
MAVRNYQDPRAGLAFVVDYCGAICVDFCGNRTMVKVDSPVISKQEASHRSPSLDLELSYEYGISPMPESHRVKNSVQSRHSRNRPKSSLATGLGS